jgi:hypothetical protein
MDFLTEKELSVPKIMFCKTTFYKRAQQNLAIVIKSTKKWIQTT